MSYRDLRNFSEAMRALGFPRPVSIESFRTPNFPLVEECLRWLAARAADQPGLPPAPAATGSSEDGVMLVTHAVALFLSRLNVKLNGRRVYGADGWAVRELLKVARVLRASLAPPAELAALTDTYDVTSQLGDIKQARRLATEITARGALLYDLLAKEPEYRESRALALSRPLDMSSIETGLRRALDAAAARAATTRDQCEHALAAHAALSDKLERRRAELARAEKRLHTVQKIKPAYQSELVALEQEISELWEAHVLRFRCVAALRHQLSQLEAARAEAAEEQQAAIMQLIHKYEAEDVLGKLSESEEIEDSSDEPKEASEAPPRPVTRPRTRLRIKTAAGTSESRRAFGSMAADSPDEDDSDLSDDDAFVLEQPRGWSGAPRPPRAAARARVSDEDDFADLIEGVGGASDSLGSSSESELRAPPAPRASAHAARPSAHAARPSAHAARPSAHAARPSAHHSRASAHAPAPSSDNEF